MEATTERRTITTRLHTYRFREPTEPAYLALCRQLKEAPGRGHWMNCNADGPTGRGFDSTSKELDGITVELETEHLFENQWNTAPIEGVTEKGLRVFDWYEAIHYGSGGRRSSVREGHYLEITDEMRAIRRDVSKCRYCGAQKPTGELTFCDRCIDSEYLKESELFLCRMVRIDQLNAKLPGLSDEESAFLVPRYREAQIHGATVRGRARITKAREDNENKYRAGLENAEVEYRGTLWLLDHAPGLTGNAIYYNHTGRWCFGWRNPLTGELKTQALAALEGFPYPFDVQETSKY